MRDISYDIDRTEEVINYHKSDNYSQVYASSNEKINFLFSDIDVKGKNVLSVVASGDQAFHFYNKGASLVDVFDVNVLSLYYYYLRVWNMEYNHCFYLNSFKVSKIKKILASVTPKNDDEAMALSYWKLFVKRFHGNQLRYMLLNDNSYNNIDDLDLIVKKLKLRNFKTYNFDICETVNIDSKYDIIYTSNISEWLAKSFRKFNIYESNLYNLLSDNGIVLSSHVSWNQVGCDELYVFQKYFDYKDISCVLKSGRKINFGYVYKKR